MSVGSPGGEEWFANARCNQGGAILELAKRTGKKADYQKAEETLEEAIQHLQSVGNIERSLEASAAQKFALQGREDALKIDSDPKTMAVSKDDTGLVGGGEAVQHSRGSESEVALSTLHEEFASASRDELLHEIEKLRSGTSASEREFDSDLSAATLDELVATLDGRDVVPTRALADRLGGLVRGVQQESPRHLDIEEKREFARKVALLLDRCSLRFELDDGTLARLRVAPTSKTGTFQFGAPDGKSRGFRKATFSVSRIVLRNKVLELHPEN